MLQYLGTSSYRSAADLDRVTLYVMGPSRGEAPNAAEAVTEKVTGLYWTTLPEFPKPTNRRLYMRPDGSLSEVAEKVNTCSFIAPRGFV